MTNFRLHHRAALRYQARPWLGAFRLLATVQALGNLAASAIAGILWTAVSPKAAFVYLAARLVLALGCIRYRGTGLPSSA